MNSSDAQQTGKVFARVAYISPAMALIPARIVVFSPQSLSMEEYYRGKKRGKRGRWKRKGSFQAPVSGILGLEHGTWNLGPGPGFPSTFYASALRSALSPQHCFSARQMHGPRDLFPFLHKLVESPASLLGEIGFHPGACGLDLPDSTVRHPHVT